MIWNALAYPFIWTALAAALVLGGIHAYLGFHVVRRGVIFVDLALAQMAALGVGVGVLLNLEHNEIASYLLALGTTLIGAVIISLLRNSTSKAPLEAFIGIIFASAQALVILLLARTPSGTEHLKETLVGSIYTISPDHVIKTGLLYIAIGVIHWKFRKQLFLITENDTEARRQGLNLFWWDLLFYGAFGFVVTSSVQIAGVLLVFGLLVIPSVSAMMVTTRTGTRLAIGWIFAAVAAFLGLILSVMFDLPAAPSILLTMTLMLTIIGLFTNILRISRT